MKRQTTDVKCQTLFSELPSIHSAKIERIGPLQARVLEDVTLFGVRVPKNFQTDGASVPRYLWWIMSPFTEGLYAALVHDFMLQRNGVDPIFRKQADRDFYYNLRSSEGINIVRCYLAWVGVRFWSRWYVRAIYVRRQLK